MLWQNRSIWRQLLRYPETLQIPRVNFRYRWCSEKIRRSFKVVLLSSIVRAWFERSRSITKIHSNMSGNGFKYRFVWRGTLKEIKKRTRFKWPLQGLSERLNMQFCVKNLQHPFFESREALKDFRILSVPRQLWRCFDLKLVGCSNPSWSGTTWREGRASGYGTKRYRRKGNYTCKAREELNLFL